MLIITVVGSSKKTSAGLAMNAIAALTFRLFPPLNAILNDDNLILRIQLITLVYRHIDFCITLSRKGQSCHDIFVIFRLILSLLIYEKICITNTVIICR